ncbi:MAG: hypothetical protein WA988_16725 [Candidatus Nanopelagicales bacterium]
MNEQSQRTPSAVPIGEVVPGNGFHHTATVSTGFADIITVALC